MKGLDRAKYQIWVDVPAGSYHSSPIYMGPYNPATGYDGPIDLTKEPFVAPERSLNVGSVSVTVSAEMSVKGRYDLTLVNQNTGVKIDVRNSVFSGDTVGNVNNSRHDFNGPPGTYKLRATLNNGVVLYYDGTIFGTRDVKKATSFKIPTHQRIQLKQFDLREFMDVPADHKFAKDIDWLAREGVMTGVKQPNGTLKSEPSKRITREAVAAFMYRHCKADISTKPGGKKLVDVTKRHKFYTEITWMSSNGITTGVKQPNGSLAFEPKDGTSREATAAFLHRAEVKKYRPRVASHPERTGVRQYSLTCTGRCAGAERLRRLSSARMTKFTAAITCYNQYAGSFV